MPEYTYKAQHESGEVWSGSLIAGSADEAAEALNKMGLNPKNIVGNAPQSPPVKSRYWTGSFVDAIQWLLWCFLLPSSLVFRQEWTFSCVFAPIIVFMVWRRIKTGNWDSGAGGGGGCGGGGGGGG